MSLGTGLKMKRPSVKAGNVNVQLQMHGSNFVKGEIVYTGLSVVQFIKHVH